MDMSDISVESFVVFNPTYGMKEGEEEKKILYHYPNDCDIDKKVKTVGLCEAIVKFTETFSATPCESVHTEKTRHVIFNPEESFWLVMILNVPYIVRSKGPSGSYAEYCGNFIQDSVFLSLLKQSYDMFLFFMGGFLFIVKNRGIATLKIRLSQFFNGFLSQLKLKQRDLLDVFSGIRFLPLDKSSFLQVQSFVNLLENKFKKVIFSVVLYNDLLVWSGLCQEDIRILYRYLIDTLMPASLEDEFNHPPQIRRDITSTTYGRYLIGPPNMSDRSNTGKIPYIYIQKTTSASLPCYLVVYKTMSVTVSMVTDASEPLSFEFFSVLDTFLGPALTHLSNKLNEQFIRKPPTSASDSGSSLRYLYFNHMNLAQKTTMHLETRRWASGLNFEVFSLLNDIHNDTVSHCGNDCETVMKTSADNWIVAKKSDQREFYVVITHKNLNLIDVTNEVKKLCSSQFTNIFFVD